VPPREPENFDELHEHNREAFLMRLKFDLWVHNMKTTGHDAVDRAIVLEVGDWR